MCKRFAVEFGRLATCIRPTLLLPGTGLKHCTFAACCIQLWAIYASERQTVSNQTCWNGSSAGFCAVALCIHSAHGAAGTVSDLQQCAAHVMPHVTVCVGRNEWLRNERQLAISVGWYTLHAVLKELVPETPHSASNQLSAFCGASCIKQLTDAQHTQLCDFQHTTSILRIMVCPHLKLNYMVLSPARVPGACNWI